MKKLLVANMSPSSKARSPVRSVLAPFVTYQRSIFEEVLRGGCLFASLECQRRAVSSPLPLRTEFAVFHGLVPLAAAGAQRPSNLLNSVFKIYLIAMASNLLASS